MVTITVHGPQVENKWSFILEVEDLMKNPQRDAVKMWMGDSNPIIAQVEEPQRKWVFSSKERSPQVLTNVKTKPWGATDLFYYC